MARSPLSLASVLGALALALASCGGDDGGDGATPMPGSLARSDDFPKPRGQTLAELRSGLGPGPVLAPSVSVLEPGENRFGFGLFDRARKQIADAPAAIYVARAGTGKASGPFPARYESLAVKGRYQSRGVAADPDAAKSVYVAQARFKDPGDYEVLGMLRLDDRLVATDMVVVRVAKDSKVPEPGERAIRISTPTRESVGGRVESIDTRVPPSTMHEADFADVLGKRPAVLVFATPALCQSRVCGPVVDIAEQVKDERDGNDAEFIHMEIYRDNEIEKGFRPQVLAWRLPTEPWVFTVRADGRVAAALEGAFSAEELDRAVDAAVRPGR